ncbi:hypothetical protein MASR2M36_27650 [Providencia sp.]
MPRLMGGYKLKRLFYSVEIDMAVSGQTKAKVPLTMEVTLYAPKKLMLAALSEERV